MILRVAGEIDLALKSPKLVTGKKFQILDHHIEIQLHVKGHRIQYDDRASVHQAAMTESHARYQEGLARSNRVLPLVCKLHAQEMLPTPALGLWHSLGFLL